MIGVVFSICSATNILWNIFNNWCQPDRIHTQFFQVVQLSCNPFKISALVETTRVSYVSNNHLIIANVTIVETVGHHKVDDLLVPVFFTFCLNALRNGHIQFCFVVAIVFIIYLYRSTVCPWSCVRSCLNRYTIKLC